VKEPNRRQTTFVGVKYNQRIFLGISKRSHRLPAISTIALRIFCWIIGKCVLSRFNTDSHVNVYDLVYHNGKHAWRILMCERSYSAISQNEQTDFIKRGIRKNTSIWWPQFLSVGIRVHRRAILSDRIASMRYSTADRFEKAGSTKPVFAGDWSSDFSERACRRRLGKDEESNGSRMKHLSVRTTVPRAWRRGA